VESDLLLFELDSELSLDGIANHSGGDGPVESDAVSAELGLNLNGLTVDLGLQCICTCLEGSGLFEHASVSLFECVNLCSVCNDRKSAREKVVAGIAICNGHYGSGFANLWHGLIQDYLHLLKFLQRGSLSRDQRTTPNPIMGELSLNILLTPIQPITPLPTS
jgi:hypothetical protein